VSTRIYRYHDMQGSIGKWGNSLAVRLPAECVRAAGLKDGEAVELSVTPTGEIRIAPVHAFDKAAFIKQLAALHRGMPESEAVVSKQRKAARY
jgi:antitoxin MazE